MTASREAFSIAHRYAEHAVGVPHCAREIDALTEQRVAAAVQEERERCAGIADNEAEDYRAMYVLEGFREDLRRKDAAARIATLIRLKPADRPAPEGAAPTTAGDVERARSIIDDAANIVGTPEALREILCKDIANALSDQRAAARAELLQQIEEPLLEAVAWAIHDAPLPPHDNNLAIRGLLATVALRALADKLMEPNNAKS